MVAIGRDAIHDFSELDAQVYFLSNLDRPSNVPFGNIFSRLITIETINNLLIGKVSSTKRTHSEPQ